MPPIRSSDLTNYPKVDFTAGIIKGDFCLKVLIVDDDINVIKCFKTLIDLKKYGYNEIFSAYNGEEAFEIAMREKVDLVITDLKMPVMDGVELCRKLREEKLKTEVILLSAYQDFAAARESVELKIYDYILKPIVPESISRLEADIEKISYKANIVHWSDCFINSGYDQEVITAFKTGSVAYFETIFDNLDVLCEVEDNTHRAQLSCLKLVDIICAFLRDMKFAEVAVTSSFEKMCQRVRELDLKGSTTYLREKIADILSLTTKFSAEVPKKDDIVDEIKKFIKNNVKEQKLDMEYISKAFNYSPDYINRIFKKNEGIGIYKYVIKCKMNEARRLVLETDMSVAEIAESLGYSSSSYFTNLFKTEYGYTPSAYRNMNQRIRNIF